MKRYHLLNIFFIPIFVFFSWIPRSFAIGDFPIGLFEGGMGNSGITLADSTAPSAYNPSLLSLKKNSSVSMGGNTIAQMQSKSNSSTTTGSAFSPSYLSSIQIFDSYAHEFFIKNSVDWNFVQESTASDLNFIYDLRFRETQFGYSFAFPGFPMGFQVEGNYSSVYGSGEIEFQSGTLRSINNLQLNSSAIHLRLGISSIFQFDNYAMGVNVKTRNAKMIGRETSKFKLFEYDSNANTFIESAGTLDFDLNGPVGHTLEIGHGFTSGAHQFITDTQLQESRALGHLYEWRQSYGYRLGVGEDHQFLCGLNHLISDQVRYFGQDAYYSVGYSWKTRTYRSGIGAFFLNKKLTENTSVYGLTFSSEFLF